MTRALLRRLATFLTLAPMLAACVMQNAPVRSDFPPLHYDYLTPLRLNVARVDIENRAPVKGPADVAPLSPVSPAQALSQMAQDRLIPGGSTGRAVFVVDDASILHYGDSLSGSFAVHLDILMPDGTRAAYTQARVTREVSGGLGDLRGAVYDLTKQMMSDMNVEFEYQIRRSLRDWLQETTPAAPAAPVQSQDLGGGAPPAAAPPPGTAPVPASPPAGLPPSPGLPPPEAPPDQPQSLQPQSLQPQTLPPGLQPQTLPPPTLPPQTLPPQTLPPGPQPQSPQPQTLPPQMPDGGTAAPGFDDRPPAAQQPQQTPPALPPPVPLDPADR